MQKVHALFFKRYALTAFAVFARLKLNAPAITAPTSAVIIVPIAALQNSFSASLPFGKRVQAVIPLSPFKLLSLPPAPHFLREYRIVAVFHALECGQ